MHSTVDGSLYGRQSMDKLDVAALNAEAVFVPVVPLMLQAADGSPGTSSSSSFCAPFIPCVVLGSFLNAADEDLLLQQHRTT
jgi:hypothetical protein